MAEFSPMMQHYLEIKSKNSDAILFYRLGDFYEMFYEDALTASKELDLTLTGKQCGQAERAPMCGVPFHSYESYAARLLEKGYKVAICEQTEDPSKAKGLVRREIVRVLTPGTIIESNMLRDDRNNYIGSIFLKGKKAGLCFADVSTGTAHVTELSCDKLSDAIITELCRYHPREVLMNTGVLGAREITAYIKKNGACTVDLMEDERFAPGVIETVLSDQFGRDWAGEKEIAPNGLVRFALGGLLQYLHDTQIKGVQRLKNIVSYQEAQFMQLSAVARANLELTETMRGREKHGTLLWVLDKTATAMGKRLLRSWVERPLVSSAAINARLDAVESLVGQTAVRGDLSEALRYIIDIERVLSRAVYGSASPKEIYALAQTCDQLPILKELLQGSGCAPLDRLAAQIDPLTELRDKICAAVDKDTPSTLKEGGVIAVGFNAEVDELRSIRSNSKDVLAKLETRLRQESDIPKLKIGYNHVFGYYIEVSNSYKDKVPAAYIRKQTLTNGERFITQELKELESKILGAQERLIALERELFEGLLQEIAEQMLRIQATATAVAELDVLVSLANVAAENDYCRPVVDDSTELKIVEGRHPVVEQMLKGSLFVPNDTLLDCAENRCLIITGPNMAGKSTYMRQNALIALMAQIGSFVPARSCHVGVVDAVFTRVGASDDLAAGQSTFMVEMTEVAEILKNATPRSLVVLDEIGRGTSTFDGMSIARAVVEHISDPARGMGCKTLFATHYHELTDMEGSMEGIKNYSIAVKKRGEDITFLRRIVQGPADDSYGIEVARLAGLPGSVTKRAREILRALEKTTAKSRVQQMDFTALEEYTSPAMPSELVEQLEKMDVETMTPIEALNFLFELKKTLKGSLQG